MHQLAGDAFTNLLPRRTSGLRELERRGKPQLSNIASMVLLHVKVRATKLASSVQLTLDLGTLTCAEN